MANFSTILSEGLTNHLLGYISGLVLSTAGSSITFTVAPGVAVDSSQLDFMKLSSSINKTTGAWTLGSGNGSLDTGSIAASTWYHVHLIKRPDTGVVDVLTSLSPNVPTMPTNYTLRRRIGSMLTNGSSNWTKFVQLGEEFLWDVPINNVSATPGTTAIQTLTLTVPTGLQVLAILSLSGLGGAGGDGRGYAFSPDINSGGALGGSGNAFYSFGGLGATGAQFFGSVNMRTNTSGQIKYSMAASTGVPFITTNGWFDTRGAL